MKATRNLSHDSACSDRDSNREYLEYGPAMLWFSQLAHFVTEVVRRKQAQEFRVHRFVIIVTIKHNVMCVNDSAG